MKTGLLLSLVLVMVAHAAPRDWRRFIVADTAATRNRPASGVRITYYGTNAYLLESKDTTLLVDPYFSRLGLSVFAFNRPVEPSAVQVAEGLARLPRRIDAVLITHGHVDHLLDAPPIATATGARLIASPTSIHLAAATGFPRARSITVLPGMRRRIAGARITTLPASHDRVLGCCVPYPGSLRETPVRPRHANDWMCGEPLAFLIEMGGKRIFIDSGGTTRVLPPQNLGRIDLAILGVALNDSRDRLRPALERLEPRCFLPSHQDDFFSPLERGFHFGSLTDFPRVRREAARLHTRMILLDYFRPWTLR